MRRPRPSYLKCLSMTPGHQASEAERGSSGVGPAGLITGLVTAWLIAARKILPGDPDPRLNLSLTLDAAGRYDDAVTQVQAAIQARPGHIASVQQLARLRLRRPAISGQASEDSSQRDALRADLQEIALRGESDEWRSWARAQLVRMGSMK